MGIITRLAAYLRSPAPEPEPGQPRRREFAAARVERLTATWKSSAQSADSVLRFSLPILRNRSRDLADNNDYVAGYLELLGNKVLGPHGVRLQVKAKGGDGKLDRDANAAIEHAFRSWGERGSCSICGRLSWPELQRLALISMARDGEVFIRLLRGKGENPSHFALQVLEADMVDYNKNELLGNGAMIRMGVEVDAYFRPVAYHVFERHPGDWNIATLPLGRTMRVPAEDMVHLYRQLRPGQTRGIPWTTPVMNRLHHLGAYEEAAIINARAGASKMGFFTRTLDAATDAGYATDDAGRTINEVEPGSLETLPPGYDFKAFTPDYPSAQFDNFVKRQIKGASCGLPGASYAELSNDLESVSFSSIRQGTLHARDSYRDLQRLMIDCLCQPVYRAWLSMSLTFGAIVVVNGRRGPNSRLSLTNFDKYNQPLFVARGWEWVDPLKDAQAGSEELRNRLTTRTRIAAEQGEDFEELLAEAAQEEQLAADYGIDLTVTLPVRIPKTGVEADTAGPTPPPDGEVSPQ